ncbi:MAG: COX15/CtaA family protein [Proteobacteria bacterium]|nr:COX15/CtaA family protein [Pseudomonadota bacterium]
MDKDSPGTSRAQGAYRALVFAAACLTLLVVVVGAYVRLSDAGLGCPDWPGCYGKLTPAHAEGQIGRAVQEQGGTHGPVSMPKAWKEMGHRYLAGTLGLMIFAIAVLGWMWRAALRQSPWLPTAIVLVVGVQATLGMWTVTMLLKPAIVTGHLAGGMATLALLVWLALKQWPFTAGAGAPRVKAQLGFARVALFVLCAQVLLGGWVSTNYAALACPDLPLCRGAVVPPMDFANAFHVVRELGMTPDGSLLSAEALTAIHWTHRMFALLVVATLGCLAMRLLRDPDLRPLGGLLAGVLGMQFALGLANVAFSLPLPLAAAHNAGAALLLALLVVINYVSFHGLAPRSGAQIPPP